MVSLALIDDVEEDQRVILGGTTWKDYEALLAIRGDRAGVRMYYLDGDIEIMSPAKIHEGRKTLLARLVEYWALETGVRLHGFGSWTLKKRILKAGAEPDECYIIGESDKQRYPDLVIEVEWSRTTGLPKEEIYLRLGVRELWTLRSDGSLIVRSRVKEAWLEQKKSKLLPSLDLTWLLSFLQIEPQDAAVRALRDAMRRKH